MPSKRKRSRPVTKGSGRACIACHTDEVSPARVPKGGYSSLVRLLSGDGLLEEEELSTPAIDAVSV
jgi:hypothetical protein